jgi:hypothetical protein
LLIPAEKAQVEYIELPVFVSRCEATLLLEKKRQIAVSSVLTIISQGKGYPYQEGQKLKQSISA